MQCERYSGEQMLSCQDSLKDLVDLEDSWVEVALCVFRRHPGLDGEPPRGQEAMRKQGRVVSELHQQLETRVNGENGQSPKHTHTENTQRALSCIRRN